MLTKRNLIDTIMQFQLETQFNFYVRPWHLQQNCDQVDITICYTYDDTITRSGKPWDSSHH